ncbi:MAG TPA: hypothetical protein VMU16_06140 [Candidatus Binataceae bacterium]|nr:hypothetical protein [Candidatus Binataceae bacterium]
MSPRKRKKKPRRGLIAKIRKPMAPPSRTLQDESVYSRKREQEQMRRETKSGS